MDDLQARHRKEQRELQSKITSKKKNATKKTRKGVNDECDRLERELKEKQQAEIAALAPVTQNHDTEKVVDDGSNDNADKRLTDTVDNLTLRTDVLEQDDGVSGVPQLDRSTGVTSQDQNADLNNKSKKPNRQKARLARRAIEHEAQMNAAAEEAALMPDRRQQELSDMKKHMEEHQLVETLIRPDGHCLYSACAKTLPASGSLTYKNVRIAAADYMDAHSEDFAPFLEESLNSYTDKIKNTAEWGGHLELQAIARAYDININVLQASGHVDKIQSEPPSERTAWLAYYHHSFGLGEHYNALEPNATS